MTCRECRRDFVSDHTPMAEAGVCLWCRPGVQVVCCRCGADCPGAHDGQQRCPACRAERLGTQQYEDAQRARYAQLVRDGVITATGQALVPLLELEAIVAARP